MVAWDEELLMWDDPHGLVFIGGDLEPDSLLGAYRRGIFPWFNEDDPYLWWSPDPRSIFDLKNIHFSKRLLRTVRQQKFHVTVNEDFPAVMQAASIRPEGTWITSEMHDAYCELHQLGFAHSVETWADGKLAGGIYGVALGGFFAAESMFHVVTDAGMVAMVHMVNHLNQRGFSLLDTQMATEHTRKIGAFDIPREVYLQLLEIAIAQPVAF